MWNNVLIISVFTATISITHQQSDHQYRSDYTYIRNSDAFYKFHIESVSHSRAEEVCEVEGAKLPAPVTDQDIEHIHAMMKQYPDLADYVWIGNDEGSHESAEDTPLIDLERTVKLPIIDGNKCDVVSRSGDEKTLPCYQRLPFICKLERRDAYYNNQCGVFGKDYELLADVGSCYKVLKQPMSWNQGYSDCRAEGSHLAVINSAAERQAVWALIKRAPKVKGSTADWFYHIGFRAVDGNATNTPREFRTIFNQTLTEAGFVEWSENEPNNNKDKEDCGSLFKNDGKFNDIACSTVIGVICEKEVNRT